MVTGVETAGLILACLPLVIEGLKLYQSGSKTIQRSIRYQRSLKKLITSANGQRFYLEDNLKKILMGADLELDLNGNYLSQLSNHSTEVALNQYLGNDRYNHFMEILRDYEASFLSLVTALHKVQRVRQTLSKNSQITLLELHKVVLTQKVQGNPFTKRITYVIEENLINSLTNELDSLNRSMGRMIQSKHELNELQSQQKPRVLVNEREANAIASMLKQYRMYTNRLFDAFCTCWATCRHPCHHVALFLNQPSPSPAADGKVDASSTTFYTMLSEGSADTQTPSSWSKATVTVLGEYNTDTLKAKKTVKFGVQNLNAPIITVTNSNPVVPVPLPIHIQDLCIEIQKAKKANKSLELRLHCGHPFVHGGLNAPSATARATISLEQLLATSKRIMPRQKSKLALKLAASILQLDTSQWFRALWSNQSFHFPTLSTTGCAQNIEIDQPLVMYEFSGTPQTVSGEFKPRLMLRELGILFLEIFNEESFESFAKREHNVGSIEDYMRDGLARSWFEATSEEMTTRYADVIGTCLSAYARGVQTWDDDGLWKTVCAKIIAPLLEEWKSFSN